MKQEILWEGDTTQGHYQVVDTIYDGRQARVLYSGNRQAAQSGMAIDGQTDLLFDYNQRMFELAINLVPRRILLLGGGVGTLPAALLAILPDVHIDMVEPDSDLTELGHRYFNLPVNDRLAVFNTDGRSFLHEHANRYDLLFVDAFTHTSIPRDMKTIEAFKAYRAHVQPDGVLAMNIISGYYGSAAQVLTHSYAAALQTFGTIDIFLASRGYSLWLPQNFVLTAQATTDLPLRYYVRHEAVKPPDIRTDNVLYDN